MTAEQLEAARAERMRQNGHGAITIEDVRTWIEETGLCIFLPRSAQAGQATSPAPTFIEAVAGQRTTEPTPELIASAESLLVRLEAEGVAVRLNLSGQQAGHTSDQPDYVVAGWVLPYIYALRGDRDWRRSPQLTGSRQVSQLAVQAAKQIDTANMTATGVRDALGREVTETAVLRALYELWKQLRIIPVVPEVGVPALWQPLRQRFQKAIAEGASTSQVTAISVLASIYLQAVIAASMEDVEMFLSPLTSRSKIREVVRGLAATRQVHSTTMGTSPMFYVAGTLPEFPALPSFQISSSLPAYRNGNYRSSGYVSSYLSSYQDQPHDEEIAETVPDVLSINPLDLAAEAAPATPVAHKARVPQPAAQIRRKPAAQPAATSAAGKARSGKASPPRPRTARSASGAGDRRRAPAPRGAASNGNGARSAAVSRGNGSTQAASSSHTHKPSNGHSNGTSNGTSNHGKVTSNGAGSRSRNGSFSNGNGNGSHTNGNNGAHAAKPHSNGNGVKNGASSRPVARPGSAAKAGSNGNGRSVTRGDTRPAARNGGNGTHSSSHSGSGVGKKLGTNGASSTGSRGRGNSSKAAEREPAASATKRYSFSGQAKQAPKSASKPVARVASKVIANKKRPASKNGAGAARPAAAKRRG